MPEPVKKRRCNELMALQGEISDEISREQIGQEFDVFVQGESKSQKKKSKPALAGAVGLTIGGRGQAAPEEDEAPASGPVQMSARTDGDMIVVFDADASERDALTGTMRRVRVTDAHSLTLKGELA